MSKPHAASLLILQSSGREPPGHEHRRTPRKNNSRHAAATRAHRYPCSLGRLPGQWRGHRTGACGDRAGHLAAGSTAELEARTQRAHGGTGGRAAVPQPRHVGRIPAYRGHRCDHRSPRTQELTRPLSKALALAGILLPALAHAGNPFATGALAGQTNILAILTPVAAIAVMASGAMAWFGRISWWWFVGVVIGIVLVFGAPQIVAWIRGLFGV